MTIEDNTITFRWDDGMSVRQCNGNWAYCNGRCMECSMNNIYATNQSETIGNED